MPSDTQNGFAFLEALTSDISVESLGRNFDGVSAHTGMKVRPSTSGNIPSTLQLLPGQSFYIGKATLSLVPEEHSDLPISSSGLSNYNFESYNYQVSQMQSTLPPSTPQRTARVGYTVMETPLPHPESENFTSILKQVTGQAISGRKDSHKWPESPLKREVMRTVRAASKHGHSIAHPELKKGNEHMADAAVNEPDRSSSQPEIKNKDVKTKDMDMANATAARHLEQGVVDLEDAEMGDADLGSEYKPRVHAEGKFGGSGRSPILKESRSLSPPVVRGRPAENIGVSSNSPILAGSKVLPSLMAPVQPERGPEASDQSPNLQAVSDSSRQLNDDLNDTPVRKKAITAAVSHEALIEESQDSLQNEIVSVKRGIPTPIARPVSTDQVSSPIPTPTVNTEYRSRSANQDKPISPTHSTGSEDPSPIIEPDSRPHPTNQLD